MPMSPEEFVDRVLAEVPEFRAVWNDSAGNPEDAGELLPHLVVSDLLRFCEQRSTRGELDVVRRCLSLVERGLADGDAALENALGVSFVEDACPWSEESAAFVALWPAAVRAAWQAP